MPNYSPGLVLVLEKIGGPTRLAEQLGVVPSAVTQWSKVPSRHVPRIEALTGIAGNIIRPDLYTAAKDNPWREGKRAAAAKVASKAKRKATPKAKSKAKRKARPKAKSKATEPEPVASKPQPFEEAA